MSTQSKINRGEPQRKIRISKPEIRNNTEIGMFKIQNKNSLKLQFSVLVIDISVIRICLEFRYSNFEFPRL